MQDENATYANFGTAGQAAVGPYGQPRVTVTSTIPPRPMQTKSVINWGGVIKGIAIVTAVIVAAYIGSVGFIAASNYLAAEIAAGSTVGAIASSIGSIATSVGSYMMTFLGNAADFVTSLPGDLVKEYGLTGSKEMAASIAASKTAIGTTGAIGAAAIAAVPATKLLSNIDFTSTAVVPADAGVDVTSAQSAGMYSSMSPAASAHHFQDLAHASQHAADHTTEQQQRSWTDRFKPSTSFASHADAVATRKPVSITSRDGNFAAQLDTDRANLEATLGQKII